MSRRAGRRGFFSQCVCCEPVSAFSSPSVSRRSFLSGSAAATALGFAAAATVANPPASAQAPARRLRQAAPGSTSTHHIVPPVHAEALARHKSTAANGSIDMSLGRHGQGRVDTAVGLDPQSGVWFGQKDEEARRLARACNEYAATWSATTRSLPLVSRSSRCRIPKGSLREIEYSLDVLKAQGIAL